MRFLSLFIKGMLIGIGAVAPGVSGGTLAVIFGLYERITEAIGNVFKNFRSNLVFFMPVILGGGAGVLIFSSIMKYVFLYYDVQVRYLFIGLMIGTLPSIFKEANKKGFRRIYMLPCLIAFAVTILFIVLENSGIDMFPEAGHGLVQLLLYGAIIGIGTIVPGISASFVLMYLGAYQIILEAMSSLNLAILIPVGIGFAVSIIAFANIVSRMFRRFYGYTYYTVLGFVLGSIVAIFPGIGLSMMYLTSISLFIIGFYLSIKLNNLINE